MTTTYSEKRTAKVRDLRKQLDQLERVDKYGDAYAEGLSEVIDLLGIEQPQRDRDGRKWARATVAAVRALVAPRRGRRSRYRGCRGVPRRCPRGDRRGHR